MMTTLTSFKSPIHKMVETTITDYWNDSSSIEELSYAIEHGAVGATTNPTITTAVLKKEMHLWKDRINQVINENPTWSEVEVTWQIFEEIAVKASTLLMPVYERTEGKKGLLSIQTNPANYRNAEAITAQAIRYNTLAPNLQIKIPTTSAGIKAIEEVTYHGIGINATVSFSVPQAIAVAEAVERGLNRRAAEGLELVDKSPVCTIMFGRVDDWMQTIINRDKLSVNPAAPLWSGIAVTKKAYQLYKERGYRLRMLGAAYRHHLQWTEFVGGDLILSMPYDWARRFNASDIDVSERIDIPVDQAYIDDLYEHIPDFRKAYDVDGMTVEEFDTYGATVRTLRGFVSSIHELMGTIRETFMLPNPDVR